MTTAVSRSPLSPFFRPSIPIFAALFSLVLSAAAAGQTSPVSETVVVTATLTPQEERDLGSAATVITREKIESSGATTVLELLRESPGVDVSRQGSDGSLTSVFLRGANSTQALVLVDGVRVNSPYFAGYDFSALTTENVERIEIVRGPFSALYGSDAIGGVVQIFTRAAASGISGHAAAEAGSAGQRQGSLFFSAGRDSLGLSGSFREAHVEGDRANSDWRERNASLKLQERLSSAVRFALEGAVLDGDAGIPGPVGAETLRARGGFREERIALPVFFEPSPRHEAVFLLAHVASKPSFRNPDDPFGFTSSDTDASTWQVRASDTWAAGPHRVTVFGSWERWQVDARDSFGVSLDGSRSTLWGSGVQDSVTFASAWVATAGLRYDRHSEFGDAWSPRGTLAWLSSGGRWKLRASAGSAFRAPSVGELAYPFVGNLNLKPERSVSTEFGAERYLPGGRLEASLFWNDFSDLIVFDFTTQKNQNIGRARTRGVELAWRQRLRDRLEIGMGYTYLEGEDRATGLPLLRRPRNRAYLSASWRPLSALSLAPRATLVGSRDDVDPVSFARVTDSSFLRYDLFVRYELPHLSPFARLENATDHRYEEVRGYPAPRRRYALGVEARY
jgi:vitamin B12 transporter